MLRTAGTPEEATFAARALAAVEAGPPGAQVLLDYLRAAPPFPWAVGPALEKLIGVEQARALAECLDEFPTGVQGMLARIAAARGMLDPRHVSRYLVAARDNSSAVWAWLDVARELFARGRNEGTAEPGAPKSALTSFYAWLDTVYPELTAPEARRTVARFVAQNHPLERATPETTDTPAVRWLAARVAAEREPSVRQEFLYLLYRAGQGGALERLVAETDAHGVAPGAGFTRDWQLLREVRGRYPNSFLARGMAAYEEVRGAPYLEIDRRGPADGWPYRYGDGQYNPRREIPGWKDFLETYSSHPGADDAAYRLGRCYEIVGDYPAALNALYRATLLPDGDCRDDAAGRIVYLLDAVMTGEQLASLATAELEPNLVPLVEYSLAVKTLRRDDFRAAAEALAGFLARHPQPRTPMSRDGDRPYDLAAAIGKQADTARRLADLKTRWEQGKDPQALYDLAAAIYHDTLTYYNHLWAGRRAEYRWVNNLESAWENDRPAPLRPYLREMINYYHALELFGQVADDPGVSEDLRAKALYSTGLCHLGLENWGTETRFLGEDFAQRALETFERFVREYPASSMADDAMLVVGVYRGDPAYLQTILERYPNGDRAADARNLLSDLSWLDLLPHRPVPYNTVREGDLPPEVAAWVATHAQGAYTGTTTLNGETYALISLGMRPTAGYDVVVFNVFQTRADGPVIVYWREQAPAPGHPVAQVITYPRAVLRLPGEVRVVFRRL
ncbi:MAG: protease complex subunit PrcB family protein [Firmicutes bacterium]|nr:protease complex subunit PrcB family protein [Bacillota bacterium]